MLLMLNDGTIIEGGSAGQTSLSLWLTFPGYTMRQAVEKVLNAEVMRRIVFQYGTQEETYTGYTKCVSISLDGNEVSICMERE